MSSVFKNKLSIIILFLTLISCTSDDEFNKISEETNINIEIKNMTLIPENIKTVENSQLTINIKSDTNGSIHFHGYDLESVVKKDKLSSFTMNLNSTGSFPIAFHASESISKHDAHHSESTSVHTAKNEHTQDEIIIGKLIVNPR